jgi:HlyD family secretion protein
MAKDMRRWRWVVGGALLVAAAVWQWRPRAMEVEVALVTRGTLRETLEEEGRTRVRRHVAIAAPVSGRVAESTLEVGDTVSVDDVVATVLPAPLDPRARAEGAAVTAQAASRVREALAQWQQATLALQDARRDLARAARLALEGAIPDRERDQAELQVQLRERDVESAQARLTASRQGERAARAAMLGGDPASAGGSPVRLTTPIAGQVLRLFEAHDRVVVAGTPLVEVGDASSIEVVCDVLSRDAVRVTPGMPMEVRLVDRAPLVATVLRVEPVAFTRQSALGIEEQRVNVIGRLEQAVTGLGDGFEVDVSIILWRGDEAMRMPSAALVPLDAGWGSYLVKDGRARLVPVEIGRRGAREVEVARGLDVGATVIMRPDERVRDGMKVSPRR